MIWLFRDQIKEMPALAGLPASVRSAPVPVQLDWRKSHPNHPAILPGAVENHLSVLRALFGWCLKRQLLTKNPASGVDAPDDPRGADPHNHPALPFAKLPDFIATLAKLERRPAKALQFAILTAARTEEVLEARWSEIDLAERTWTIPALRMKSKKEHIIRKRCSEALVPAPMRYVLDGPLAEGFELSLWTTLMTTRRQASGVLRF
jgi:hypothetical protein